MTPERWQQIKDLLQSTTECIPAERAAWLAAQCGEDAELRQEVESLLAVNDTADDFMRRPLVNRTTFPPLNATGELSSGQNVGQYQIEQRIGAGGMGVVYRALDVRLERPVALKLMPPGFVKDAERVRRFRQEARAISALNHPNILTIHEIGETETANGRTYFIATEFVEGCTLRAALQAGELTLGIVLDVLIQTATALTAAHQAGVIHRDLKPENLMLRPDGVVKVLDFGLAKMTMSQPAQAFSTVNTTPGLIMGTVSYMSPEQARGLEVDERTDIFSLGVVLYELLTGQPAFAGATTGDVLAALLEREPPLLKDHAPHAPAALQGIVNRAVAKDRAARYPNCAALLGELKALKQALELAAHVQRAGDTPVNVASLSLRVGRSSNDRAVTAEKTTVPTAQPAARATNQSWGAFRRWLRPGQPLAKTVPLATLLIAAVWAVWAVWQWKTGGFKTAADVSTINAIAVLPFVNVNADPQLEYLSDGLTESLMQSLQQVAGLRVMARATMFSYKGRDVDPRQIGQALQVRAVINGRMQQQGEWLLVRVELADARDGARLWGVNYQRSMKDLPGIQTELTQAVSDQLAQRFGAKPAQQLVPSQNAEAYRLYLLGLYHANQQTQEDSLKALAYYQQAIGLDSAYALAYTGIADIYAYSSSRYLAPQEAMPKARQAALKALALNPALAEAHHSLAMIKCWGDWDWQGAEQEFKRALELNPNLAITHTIYANMLSFQRRFAEFRREIKLAQQLDPLSALALEMSVWGLYFERSYDEALTESDKLIALHPNYFRVYEHRADIYRQQGRLREAIAELEKPMLTAARGRDTHTAKLAYLYAVDGQTEKARHLLSELNQPTRPRLVSPFLLAKIEVGLGEYDRAFARLQETFDAHSEFIFSLNIDPVFDPLRADPRFKELVRKVGLQP